MPASRSRATMLSLLPQCAVALLLSPASADPALLGPAAGHDVKYWAVHSPAEALILTREGAETVEYKAADFVAAGDHRKIAVPPPATGRQRLRAPHLHAALSPEARSGLDHEARCGPRVPVRPSRNPRCRSGGNGAAAGVPVVRRLFPAWSP